MRRDKEVSGQHMSKQMAESRYGLTEQTKVCDKEGTRWFKYDRD